MPGSATDEGTPIIPSVVVDMLNDAIDAVLGVRGGETARTGKRFDPTMCLHDVRILPI